MTKAADRRWLRAILKPVRPVYREVAIMSFFVNCFALATPIFVLQVYDRVVFYAGLSTLKGLVVGMIIVLAFDLVLRQSRSGGLSCALRPGLPLPPRFASPARLLRRTWSAPSP